VHEVVGILVGERIDPERPAVLVQRLHAKAGGYQCSTPRPRHSGAGGRDIRAGSTAAADTKVHSTHFVEAPEANLTLTGVGLRKTTRPHQPSGGPQWIVAPPSPVNMTSDEYCQAVLAWMNLFASRWTDNPPDQHDQ
jgi:hypothetical protein